MCPGKNSATVAEFQLFSACLRVASQMKTWTWVIKGTNHNGLNSGISALYGTVFFFKNHCINEITEVE